MLQRAFLSRRPHFRSRKARCNTPLNSALDVIMKIVLSAALMFFVATNGAHSGNCVPQKSEAVAEISVHISSDGLIEANGEPVTLAELEEILVANEGADLSLFYRKEAGDEKVAELKTQVSELFVRSRQPNRDSK